MAYGLLTTPDRVQIIVLPTDGLIAIGFNAEWKESVAAASRAAIFIGATQLKVWNQTVAAPLQAASEVGADVYAPLASCSLGLVGFAISGVSGVATGQIVGGFGDTTIAAHLEVGGTVEQIASRMPIAGLCYVFAAAGTYDVSVQFKSLIRLGDSQEPQALGAGDRLLMTLRLDDPAPLLGRAQRDP